MLGISGSPVTSPLNLRSDVDIMCYDRCYGIDRADAVDGINWFCNYFSNTNTVLHYNAKEGLLAATGNYTYNADPSYTPGYYEKGIASMSMGFYFDGVDKTSACKGYYAGYEIEYNDCFDGLTAAIDK